MLRSKIDCYITITLGNCKLNAKNSMPSLFKSSATTGTTTVVAVSSGLNVAIISSEMKSKPLPR